jgi:hypothetical protein
MFNLALCLHHAWIPACAGMTNNYPENIMACLQTMQRIRERLPELERQISKCEEKFPLHLLPKGLFRDVYSGMDCIADILRDLDIIQSETSERVVTYCSMRLSQKIHVLVHICRTQSHKMSTAIKPVLETISTRSQWLEQLQNRQRSLSLQRAAILKTLERADAKTVPALQKELQDIDLQLSELFH